MRPEVSHSAGTPLRQMIGLLAIAHPREHYHPSPLGRCALKHGWDAMLAQTAETRMRRRAGDNGKPFHLRQ